MCEVLDEGRINFKPHWLLILVQTFLETQDIPPLEDQLVQMHWYSQLAGLSQPRWVQYSAAILLSTIEQRERRYQRNRPSRCKSPRAQNRALNRDGVPSGSRFSLNTQVSFRTLRSGIRGTMVHVLCCTKVTISNCMALTYSSAYSPFIAWWKVGESGSANCDFAE